MLNLFEEAFKLTEQKRTFVLATVVRTKGSTPQKAGAKMLIREDGSSVGTLGGGCVEGDIWYIATEMLRKKEPPQYRSYTLNEELAAEDGLICGGTMYFWIEPIYSSQEFLPYLRPILNAIEGGSPVSLATVVKSAPSPSESGTDGPHPERNC